MSGTLFVLAAGVALAVQVSQADPGGIKKHPVTATPPLQAVPATPASRNVQQRMRNCNATADARKLQPVARETFLKICMAPHHSHAISRPGSQAKPDP